MTQTIDELLDEIRRLSAAITAAGDRRAERDDLVDRREALRAEAARRSDTYRHPESVRTEVERIEARLGELEDELIGAGYSEKHLQATIQDPGAYRHVINRTIADNHAEEVDELRQRLDRLRSLLPTDPDPDA